MNKSYKQGFIDGMTAHAHWRDGVQYVGTTGTTLAKAVDQAETTWNFSPPAEASNAELLAALKAAHRSLAIGRTVGKDWHKAALNAENLLYDAIARAEQVKP